MLGDVLREVAENCRTKGLSQPLESEWHQLINNQVQRAKE